MRLVLTTISLIFSILCFSQVTTFETALADSGKYEFKKQARSQTPDYSVAYRILTNQVNQNPKSAELRYFLGCTIDKINGTSGEKMFQLKKKLTIKASEQFEEVNKLEPIYKGEKFISDPYSKLTLIWGSMAEAYLNRNLVDSARWAFLEGKERGGFIEPLLEFNRQLLNSCERNSILLTYGDLITIPIWYLQTIENFRNDITVVDLLLINTSWYPGYLKDKKNLSLGLSSAQLDSIKNIQWQSKIVEIVNARDTSQKLSWELRPTYKDSYIRKGDRILLDMLQQNFFTRPIYFSARSDTSLNLFLTKNLIDEGLVSRISNKPSKEDIVWVSKNLNSYNIRSIKAKDIRRSGDAIAILNGFRWTYYSNVHRLASRGNYDKAMKLIKQMRVRFSKKKLPFASEEQEKYFTDLFKQVHKNNR